MRRANIILEVLKELNRAQRIEDPIEKAAALRELLPRLRDVAHLVKDKTMIDIVNKFADIEEESRVFFEAESIRRILGTLRQHLQRARSFLPLDVIRSFSACIDSFSETLEKKQRLLYPSVKAMFLTVDQLNHQLVAHRLERYITPSLLKQMGYKLGTTIYEHNNVVIEIDALGEKTETSAPEGQGKILKKEILIVECKRTVTKKDITDFIKKTKIVSEKHEQIAQILKHPLKAESWLIACYGWTDKLKDLSKENGIKPIDKDELESLSRRYRVSDRRLPVCPENVES